MPIMVEDNQLSQLLFLLDKLALELKAAKLWSFKSPPSSALQSQQPFCYDTLKLEQWLQFVFIERLKVLVSNKQALPQNIAITPMAENVFQSPRQVKVIDVITDIDELLSGKHVSRPWRSKR